MFAKILPALKLTLPYIYAVFITAICLFFMYLGKLDVSVGLGIIATMGLGSCLHKGNKAQIQTELAPLSPLPPITPLAPLAPPCPDPTDTPSVTTH